MDFKFEKDGWVHVMPLGEFPHAEAGVVQVIDSEALKAITEDFKAKAGTENFPGLLVDFDHFSMDTDKPSEAAGWITELKADTEGLWAKVRWTAKGEAAVTGGEYRLVSPVFPKPSLCEDLGESRIRPRQLQSVALTNEPNIKGAKPLTNREPSTTAEPEKEPKAVEPTPETIEETPNRWSDASRLSALAARRAKNEARKAAALEHLKQLDQQRRDNRYKLKPLSPISTATTSKTPIKSFTSKPVIPKSRYYFDGAWYDNQGNFVSRSKPARRLANRSTGDEKRYKWILGKTKSGTHCPGCQARNGKIKTATEWKAMGKTACGSRCKCKLVPQ
jgi:phage I-like protein